MNLGANGSRIPVVFPSGIRAGDGRISTKEGRYQATIKYIIIIGFIFFFGYWAVRELVDYYPSITNPSITNSSSRTEGFADTTSPAGTTATSPAILLRDPRPSNNPQSVSDSGIDLDVLRSHRYYDVDIRKQAFDRPLDPSKPEFALEKAPLTNLDTLTQEMPTTYFIDLLGRVMPLSITFPDPEPIRFLLAHQPGGTLYNPQTPVYRWDRLERMTARQLTTDPPLKHLFETAKLNIITAINLKVLEQKESHAKHPFSTFRIIQSEFMSLSRTNSGELQMVVNLVLHRPFKTHTFNIQARIAVPLQSTSNSAPTNNGNTTPTTTTTSTKPIIPLVGRVTSLELVGSTIQNQVQGLQGQPRGFIGDTLAQQQASGVAGAPLTDNPHADIYPGMDIAMAEPKSPIDFDASRAQVFKEAQTKLEAAQRGSSISFLERSREGGIAKDPLDELTASGKYKPLNYNGDYKCFTVSKDGTIREDAVRGVSPIACQSADPATGMVGVWDNPCKSDDECPFWRANKNYTNSFGGCQPDGKCQLPAGLDQYHVGFKKYHKAGVAKTECYNCPRDPLTGLPRFDCCAAQLGKNGSGSMLSPDYRFAGDEQLRNRPDIVKELAAKGLLPA
jgi:hypothetical protein